MTIQTEHITDSKEFTEKLDADPSRVKSWYYDTKLGKYVVHWKPRKLKTKHRR